MNFNNIFLLFFFLYTANALPFNLGKLGKFFSKGASHGDDAARSTRSLGGSTRSLGSSTRSLGEAGEAAEKTTKKTSNLKRYGKNVALAGGAGAVGYYYGKNSGGNSESEAMFVPNEYGTGTQGDGENYVSNENYLQDTTAQESGSIQNNIENTAQDNNNEPQISPNELLKNSGVDTEKPGHEGIQEKPVPEKPQPQEPVKEKQTIGNPQEPIKEKPIVEQPQEPVKEKQTAETPQEPVKENETIEKPQEPVKENPDPKIPKHTGKPVTSTEPSHHEKKNSTSTMQQPNNHSPIEPISPKLTQEKVKPQQSTNQIHNTNTTIQNKTPQQPVDSEINELKRRT